MKTIYEVTAENNVRGDYDTLEEAKAIVEKGAWGRVVTFHRGADGRDRSGAMIVWENGKWRGVDISR